MNESRRNEIGRSRSSQRAGRRMCAAVAMGGSTAMMFAAPLAFAATYEVGPGKPYADLKGVASKLAPGDVVEVQGGTTYAGGVVLDAAGTAAAKITIRGIPVGGQRPILSGGTNTVEFRGDHYVLEGFDITKGSSRCVFHHADDITVRGTVIHDCPGQGLLGADSDAGSLTLSYVEVYKCGNGDRQHQIYMATDETAHPGSVFRMEHCYVHDGNGGNNIKSRAERNEIYYNWIEGAFYRELELIGPDGQDSGLAREDSDVVGNVLHRTRGSYIARLGGDGTGDTGGRYRFVNNTILATEGSSAVFQMFDSIESVEMHNNVFYATSPIYTDGDASWVSGKAVITGSNNWVKSGAGSIPTGWVGTLSGADPGFTDLGSWDLRPTAASPLVDHGTATPASPAGFPFGRALAIPTNVPPAHAEEADGQAETRPPVGVIDIGAYEYGDAPPDQGGGAAGGPPDVGGGTMPPPSSDPPVSTGSGGAGGTGGSSPPTGSPTGATGGSPPPNNTPPPAGSPGTKGSAGASGSAGGTPREVAGTSCSVRPRRASSAPSAWLAAGLGLAAIAAKARRRRSPARARARRS